MSGEPPRDSLKTCPRREGEIPKSMTADAEVDGVVQAGHPDSCLVA